MLKTVMLIISKLWIACSEGRESEYITKDFSFNRRISSRAFLIVDSSAVYTLDLSGRRMLNLISTNHSTGYGFTSFRTVGVYFHMLAKTVVGFCKNDSVELLH